MSEEYSLGVDLGGTKIYAVITNSENRILARTKLKTPPGAGVRVLAEYIRDAGVEVAEKADLTLDEIRHVGIAIPSSVDPETGDCLHAPNLGLKNVSFKSYFKEIFKQEIYLQNDVNCGTLGEFYRGAAQGCKSVVGFFAGTGLGGGVIINGRLLTGTGGVAGELGHMTVKYNGRRCECGHRGCLEAYSSKTGIVKSIRKEVFKKQKSCSIIHEIDWENLNVKSKYLTRAYRDNDEVVVRAINKAMKILGAAASSMVAAVSPECIILGGGLMESAGKDLLPVFMKSFREHVFAVNPDKIKVQISQLGDDAVAMGALILAQKKGKV